MFTCFKIWIERIVNTYCHTGLALYGDYSWDRLEFYNSSLKIFEYLVNGLLTITNKRRTDIQQPYSNYTEAKDTDEIITLVKNMLPQIAEPLQNGRTWKHVAAETANILTKTGQ